MKGIDDFVTTVASLFGCLFWVAMALLPVTLVIGIIVWIFQSL